jgi:NADH-quinone oxidoreductase subunit N
MTWAQLSGLAPLLILAAGTTLIMLQIAFYRRQQVTVGLSQATVLLAALSTGYIDAEAAQQITPLLRADGLALVMSALFCLMASFTIGLSTRYLNLGGDEPEEYFLLLILSTLGACTLAYATHMASLILGLELMSIALYALIAYPDKSILPLEASIKYLVLSGAASATGLFGFALLYSATGTLGFSAMGEALHNAEAPEALLVIGSFMIVTGMGFKLSAAPFHLWTPDVYQGAPAPVAGFLAAVSKAAVFIALFRLFIEADLFRYPILTQSVGLMALFSMLAGNLAALLQTNLKRMLAYSSIAHIGYLLILFMASMTGPDQALAIEAASYYLIAYSVTSVAAFGVISLITTESDEREHVELQDISGLFWRNPLLASLLLVALLSLAGIPLTAGFIAKFYIIGNAVAGNNWILLAVLVIGSGIGIYYYLRAVFYMTRRPDEHDRKYDLATGWRSAVLPCALIAAILLLGTTPQPLLTYLRSIL